jgi:diguanylate cyclase (GGDEF)-like protein
VNNKSIIENVMHFLVHNSILFTVEVMCLVHVTLLGLTWYAGIMPMVLYNVFSVTIYLFCIMLCHFGHVTPVFYTIIIEVSLYSAVSLYYIGWDYGTYCFLFSIVPIELYFGTFLFSGKKRMIVFASLVIIFGMYLVLYFVHFHIDPAYDMPYIAGVILMIFSSFVMFFAMIFYSMVYIYASEHERTNLVQENEQLASDANNDALTGLLNRRGFLPIVSSLMTGDPLNHFCIAFCDIDNFKRINDSYGHDCGDEVLQHVSKLIKREMHGCSICRWGGEEIVILMRDYDMAVAKQKMEYVRRLIETSPTAFYNKRIMATVTIGLEESGDAYKVPDEIIKVADERMYYGKQHGKNILIAEPV